MQRRHCKYLYAVQVSGQVLNEQVKSHILRLCEDLVATADRFSLSNQAALKHLNGDLRALLLVMNSIPGGARILVWVDIGTRTKVHTFQKSQKKTKKVF
jgi:hypothetical protein